MTALPELRSALVDAAELQQQHAAANQSMTRTRGIARRRWWLWRGVPAVLLFVLGGTAVAFASGLVSFGAPAQSSAVFSNPRAGLGALTPGTVKLLPIATADPQGGPPWGIRILSTTRGVGCIQVGRLVNGKLVALGRDGAFGDDGRAHALPLSTPFDQFSCAALDGKGQIFNNVILANQAASAAWAYGPGECVPAGTPPPANPHGNPACPQRDERNLYYGLLGPEAKSITYTVSGQRHTTATVGPQGAYLIVTDAPTHQLFASAGGGTSDVVPVDGPITSIQYRNGAICHLTSRSWIGGSSACTPSLQEPVGYVPVVNAPTPTQVVTPIHARLIRASQGRHEIIISFKSRVAITSLRSQYQLETHDPGMPPKVNSYTTMRGLSALNRGGAGGADNIAAGQTVTTTIGGIGPALPSGITRGTVSLVYSTGPALYEGPGTVYVPVGSFSLKVP